MSSLSDCEQVAQLFADYAVAVLRRERPGSTEPLRFPRDACPDDWRGVYNFDAAMESGGYWVEATRQDRPLLVLVLESPHVDEFEHGPGFRAIGPAMGRTGENIRSHLGRALRATGLRGQMDVLLTNAIQHQCSLGSIFGNTSTCRNEIFIHLWDHDEQSAELCFRRRLEKAVAGRRKVTLVNCCTQGARNLPVSLRERVQVAIDHVRDGFVPDAVVVRRAHPCGVHWLRGTTWEPRGLQRSDGVGSGSRR